MNAKKAAVIWTLVVGSTAFPLVHAQAAHTQTGDNTNTARIDIKGSITHQDPGGWVSAVFVQSSDGGGVYQVIFSDAAPSAKSCTATPDNSDLEGTVDAPMAEPHQLLVSFHALSSKSGVATPVPSAFRLTCAISSP
ncbi:hypothetical protein [Dyella mobilis]|uniref:Uncharacterized protein n=1 Tax=Dyella mobilis TaxID=1849582 RepID=A0ABS2KCK1_9GAMM|nr:hypothetical protein [Dyella mobilis]MBM7128889.1 hypothetical protein [Dyella mobilis]